MKEEQQIRVRAEIRVERDRTGIERDRTRVEEDRTMVDGYRTRVDEFWFILIGLIALNRSWHPVFIGWGGLTLVGLIKSIFRSLN
jgi:hypothetical protein